MNWLCHIAAIAIVAGTLPAAKAEEAGSKDFAARTELHQIATLTLSDRQFLEGDANGKPMTITGELRIAQGSGRLPVVVLEHGSGGLSANIEFWARALNEQGISSFALDGFTGRGLTEVATKAYVERLKSAGRDVALTEYPNAPHSFDNPLGAQPAMLSARSQSVRHCTIREETLGTLINVDTRQPFSYEDSCVERGAHLGADPAAAEAARATVTAFLRATFKLD
jgi:dienelactone hydrolase